MQKDNEQLPSHIKLPTGEVISHPVKGKFFAVPLLGWLSMRADSIFLLNTVCILVTPDEELTSKGSIRMEYPIYDDLELDILDLLHRNGWNGKIWPRDNDWPPPDSDDAGILTNFLSSSSLKNTLSFIPYTEETGEGMELQEIHVQRARGPFLMPPLPKFEGDPTKLKLDEFRELKKDVSVFFFVH